MDDIYPYKGKGEITIRAKIRERAGPGIVFIPFHFKDELTNILTNLFLNPIAKRPELKVRRVSIKKIECNS